MPIKDRTSIAVPSPRGDRTSWHLVVVLLVAVISSGWPGPEREAR